MRCITPVWILVLQLRRTAGRAAGGAPVLSLRAPPAHSIRVSGAAQRPRPNFRPPCPPAGCTLPIEVWFPESEYPPAAAVEAFERLGATARVLDFRWGPRGAWGLGVGYRAHHHGRGLSGCSRVQGTNHPPPHTHTHKQTSKQTNKQTNKHRHTPRQTSQGPQHHVIQGPPQAREGRAPAAA